MSHKVREDLFTSEEAEKYLKIAPGTLKQWRHAGRGPDYLKNQGFVRYLQSDLDFWLDSCKQGVRF